MTDIEQKALALVNEFRAATRNPPFADWSQVHLGATAKSLLRAIEQHEAFRREVSDAVEAIAKACGTADPAWGYLRRFIIAQPDPLVEALNAVNPDVSHGEGDVELFRTALAKIKDATDAD